MTVPVPQIVAIAVIAAVQGVGLIGYATFDLIESIRIGVSGPEEVSNVPAVIVLIVIQLLLGAGLLWVARGWWQSARWARSPFLVAQLLGILIGYELSQSVGSVEKAVGYSVVIIAVVGVVLSFLPAVSRAIDPQI